MKTANLHYGIIGTILVAIVCLYSFSGCQEKLTDTSKTLVIQDSIRFPVDTLSNYFSRFIKYYTDPILHKDLLVIEQESTNSWSFYDFHARSLIKKISFAEEGPDNTGINGIGGGLIFTADSVIVNCLRETRLALVNGNGQIIRRYDLPDFTNFPLMHTNQQPNLYKDYLYFNAIPTNLFKPFYQLPIEYRLDLKTGEYEAIIFHPEEFKGFFALEQNQPGRTVAGSKIVLTYPISSDLFIYDMETGRETRRTMPSAYAQDVEPLRTVDLDYYDYYLRKNPMFFSIIFDPFREVFYRFILLAFPEEYVRQNLDILPSTRDRTAFAIQVISLDFELLTEIKMPPNTYEPSDYFVNEQGLYISNNHRHNPNLDENYLSFTRFEWTTEEE